MLGSMDTMESVRTLELLLGYLGVSSGSVQVVANATGGGQAEDQRGS